MVEVEGDGPRRRPRTKTNGSWRRPCTTTITKIGRARDRTERRQPGHSRWSGSKRALEALEPRTGTAGMLHVFFLMPFAVERWALRGSGNGKTGFKNIRRCLTPKFPPSGTSHQSFVCACKLAGEDSHSHSVISGTRYDTLKTRQL